jgi:transcriptional regulator with PAS, ATPase and Fis domain
MLMDMPAQAFVLCAKRGKCNECAPIANYLKCHVHSSIPSLPDDAHSECMLCLSDFGPNAEAMTRKLLDQPGIIGVRILGPARKQHAAVASFVRRFRRGDVTTWTSVPREKHRTPMISQVEVSSNDNCPPRQSTEQQELTELPNLPKGYCSFGELILPHAVRNLAKAFSKDDHPILITGETGTGKSHIARIIHNESHRRNAPFVAINCATLSDTLIESQLFGHTKGAFTGADCAKSGLVAAADGGTLFLDEIGELPRALQAKLLTLMQEREYRPVGAISPVASDFRCISATNANITGAPAGGAFRHDLLYRLSVLTLHLDPLRSAPEVLEFLITRIIRNIAIKRNAPALSIDRDALLKLRTYSWPGNYRQLINTLVHAAVISSTSTIGPDSITLPESSPTPTEDTLHWKGRTLRAIETDAIRHTLALLGNNKAKTARSLGISESGLHAKLKSLR